MSGRKSYVSWGEGIAFDSVNGLYFVGLEQVNYNLGMELIQIPDGDSMSDDFVEGKAPVTGHLVFNKLNADLFAMLTGGEATAGGYTRIRNEAHTAVGGTFGLDNAPVSYSEIIRKVDGPIMKRVSSGATGDEYTISGATVTVTGGLTASFVCDYFKDNASTIMTVSVDYNDLPSSFGIISSHRAVDKDRTSETKGDIFILCPKIRRSSEIKIGGEPGSPTKIEFDFVVEKATGNPLYKVMFPTA
jgi:hypothetical protein